MMIMMPGSGAGVRDGGAGGDGAPVQLPRRPGPGPGAWQGGSAANRLIGEVVQSRRRPLLGPSPG